MENMGWIGVDLFFVLSGFLVSALLFKEYLKFGDIHVKRFLIRRGFKIYPIYYIFYLLYLIPIVSNKEFSVFNFLSDLTFLQNYISGWGYAFYASWSLAVEEHFYLGFSLLLWWGIKQKKLSIQKLADNYRRKHYFGISIITILFFCLISRVISNIVFPDLYVKNFTMTHLRIDSFLGGVFIAYLFYFRNNYLKNMFQQYKYLLLFMAGLSLVWTPFIDPVPSFFVKTFGFTLLYISFSIILLYFILDSNINQFLDNVFSSPIVNIVSKVGYCSYSIYIIHSFVNNSFHGIFAQYDLYINHYLYFIITSLISITFGIFMTYIMEAYFLKIRDKYYPGRV
jgi:peptidoglycan/LPS O-acetylase OafA/YrhL